MAPYFKQSEVTQVSGIVTNVTRAGAAFATTESEEQIFIPVRITQQNSIDVGDTVSAYVILSLESEEVRFSERPPTAKYRAIRASVTARMGDVLPASSISGVMSSGARGRNPLSKLELAAAVTARLSEPYCWTAREMADDISGAEVRALDDADFAQSVQIVLSAMHSSGSVAVAKVYAKGGQDRASHVFFASSTDVFTTLLEYEVE